MSKHRIPALTGLVIFLSTPVFAQQQGPTTTPGSLFNTQAGDGVIHNRIAMHKGDLLTLVVNESQTGTNTNSTSTTKKDTTTMNSSVLQSLTGMFGGSLGTILNSPFNSNGTNVNSATAGSGTTSTSTSYTANVTVVVMDVLPNGNLVLEGKRTIKMNKNDQTILLEGTCRPDDVAVNNTIQSQQVADLRLEAEGKGLIASRQREGILTRVISWLF